MWHLIAVDETGTEGERCGDGGRDPEEQCAELSERRRDAEPAWWPYRTPGWHARAALRREADPRIWCAQELPPGKNVADALFMASWSCWYVLEAAAQSSAVATRETHLRKCFTPWSE